jgi:hypothetical protein
MKKVHASLPMHRPSTMKFLKKDIWCQAAVSRRDQEHGQEIRNPNNTGAAAMSDFRSKLQDLNSGDFLEVVADVVREQTRRATNKDPSTMTDSEYRQWSNDLIKKSEQQARAAEAAKEQADG